MFIDESGNLVLVNVSEDHSGHYQCQVNESGAIRNGSSYKLTIQNLTGSLYGEAHLVTWHMNFLATYGCSIYGIC